LELLTDKTGFVDNLLALRQLKKILSTYLEAILARMDRHHRIHGTFNQHGTKTGRLSSSDPNLQNIIKRTKYKKVEEAVAMVMRCFVPPARDKVVQADYSQAELRMIAHYAGEDNMLNAYNNGEDLHALTAATTLGISLDAFKKLPDDKRKRSRYEAKSTNFGFIYGMSPEGFKEYARTSYGIDVTLKQAQDRRKAFFSKYSKLPEYHKTYIAKAKKFGYVRTLFGRKVRLPEIYSNEQFKQGHAERNAINSPIQGTAGEMMIFAIALLYRRAPGLQTVNTIHDSLVYYGGQYNDLVKETMENLPMLEYFGRDVNTVSMAVDFEESESSWGELKEV
jgi:DNA polymerase-1